MTDSTSIINEIIDQTVVMLVERLKTDVAGETSQAHLVRAGKLQADPTVKKINVLMHPGGEEWPDILNTNDSGSDLSAPTYTIGGIGTKSVFWRRRFKIEFQIFFATQGSRDSARTKAQIVMSRALHALVSWSPQEVINNDSFGEHLVSDAQPTQSWIREGGGEGDFSWRGEMRLEFVTEMQI